MGLVRISVVLVGAASLAATFMVAPLSLVSGPTPFHAGCDGSPLPPGANYLNAKVEPRVAVNPTTPLNVVGVWQQDRWSDDGSHGLLVGVSHDGGRTWTRSFAHFSRCAGGTQANGGDYERATDPWVSFAPNCDVYQVSLSTSPAEFASSGTLLAGPGTSAILVSKSTDGGDTWSEPITLIRDSAPNVLNDKESITADPTDSTHVYAVWHRLFLPTGGAGRGGDAQPSPRPSVTSEGSRSCDGCRSHTGTSQPQGAGGARRDRGIGHGELVVGERGPTWFSRTKNGGKTWQRARVIFDPGPANQTMGNQIVVLPNGDLVNGFNLVVTDAQAQDVLGMRVAVIRSTNKGATWTTAIIIDALRTVGVRDPETGRPIRSGDAFPDFAVDRSSGRLYAVWQDGRFSDFRHNGIAFSSSADGGFTWSTPARVNQTPLNIAPGNQQAFTPSVHVADDGTIGVTYYDLRNNTRDPVTLPTDYWLVSSRDAGETWTETHIAGPFDITTAPVAGGYFLGDYQGLASSGGSFLPFFILANSGNLDNRTDVFATLIGR